jgi:hypothetical protein
MDACAAETVTGAPIGVQFWSFSYDPATGTAQIGPYKINIEQAQLQARQPCRAIYTAARAVDAATAAE